MTATSVNPEAREPAHAPHLPATGEGRAQRTSATVFFFFFSPAMEVARWAASCLGAIDGVPWCHEARRCTAANILGIPSISSCDDQGVAQSDGDQRPGSRCHTTWPSQGARTAKVLRDMPASRRTRLAPSSGQGQSVICRRLTRMPPCRTRAACGGRPLLLEPDG